MAEDSGAFKTNPAKSRQIRHFVINRSHRCSQASPVSETHSNMNGALIALIFNKHHEYVAVSSNQPDSLRAGGIRCVANAANSVVTAFPMAQWPLQTSREGETGVHAPRLPFFIRRHRAVDVDHGVRPWRGGAAARGP